MYFIPLAWFDIIITQYHVILELFLSAEAPHDIDIFSNRFENIAPLSDNVTLQCNNKGGPNNTYVWRKDGIILDGETRNTLNLTSIVPSSGGFYNCTVNNAAGFDSASIALIGKNIKFQSSACISIVICKSVIALDITSREAHFARPQLHLIHHIHNYNIMLLSM